MITPGSILLTGSRTDPHLAHVAAELRRRGHDPLMVYPGDLPEHAAVGVRLGDGSWTAEMSTADSTASLTGVHAVFARKPDDFQLAGGLPETHHTFAHTETRHTVRGIWNLLEQRPGCLFMNHPGGVTAASVKLAQLQHATRLGLRIPRTIVTNDPADARDFRAECGGRTTSTLLSKPAAGSGRVSTGLALATMERHDVPVMLQEQVISIRTLRVIVAGRRAFTGTVLPDAPGDSGLPPQVAQRCVELVHGLGIRYAAIDLAVTPDGDHVFLELDPEGPFLDTNAVVPTTAIIHAIAGTLIDAATSSASSPHPR